MANARTNPVEEFRAQLRALYKAAGGPSFQQLAQRTKAPSSSLHAWVSGDSVPSPTSKDKFAALVAVLQRMADRKNSEYERQSDMWWEELWQRAWHHNQSAKAGRRPRLLRTVGRVPANVDCYEDRPHFRGLLETSAPGGTTVLGQVITGMGGVGKTQLAASAASENVCPATLSGGASSRVHGGAAGKRLPDAALPS
jgi:hypothetical protein